MKLTPINAPDAPQPAGGYAQAMLVSGATDILFISGQIGVDRNDVVGADFEAQAQLIWNNIDAQLRAAGMSKDNLVKVTIFLSDRKYIPAYRAARQAYLGARTIGLTTIITGIFDETWLLEIEAVAAR